jgi:hypothetical protein
MDRRGKLEPVKPQVAFDIMKSYHTRTSAEGEDLMFSMPQKEALLKAIEELNEKDSKVFESRMGSGSKV